MGIIQYEVNQSVKYRGSLLITIIIQVACSSAFKFTLISHLLNDHAYYVPGARRMCLLRNTEKLSKVA